MFSLFLLLTISSGAFFLSKKIRVPYTVLLVAIGSLILVPLSRTHEFGFIDDFVLTPNLLFYIFLPILIFESAYNINIRRFVESVRAISLLAVVSLFISAVGIGFVLRWSFLLIGLDIPYSLTFLFGALISATDPVAVLALFKEYGVPRRLSLIFEGESIFNDGTAVALFFIILGLVVSGGTLTGASIATGAFMFLMMVFGGALIGIVVGGVFSKLIGFARENEFISITLMISLAHLTFIGTDLLSQAFEAAGSPVRFSAIIATTLASMVVGNYGRSKVSPHAEEFIEKFWAQFAFLSNSLVFLLIGLIFASLPFSAADFVVPVLLGVFVVASWRAISIYPVLALLNWTRLERPIPRSWQHLLAWGSLRGALAITMVLLIPDTLSVPGWQYGYSPKEFVLALTIGCIFATLFIKATTIGYLLRRLGISNLTDLDVVDMAEARALMHTRAISRINDYSSKGYMRKDISEQLKHLHRDAFALAQAAVHAEVSKHKHSRLADRALRLYAIGVERHYLKELYQYHEITEKVYKQISIKLSQQHERIEHGNFNIEQTFRLDRKEVFEYLSFALWRMLKVNRLARSPEEHYMYYRAQSIIARKVLKEFSELERSMDATLFDAEALAQARELYDGFRTNAAEKMHAVEKEHPLAIAELSHRLAQRGLIKVQEQVLEELEEKEMISPKVSIALAEEIALEASLVPAEPA